MCRRAAGGGSRRFLCRQEWLYQADRRSTAYKQSRICFSCDPVNQWVMRKDIPGDPNNPKRKTVGCLTGQQKPLEMAIIQACCAWRDRAATAKDAASGTETWRRAAPALRLSLPHSLLVNSVGRVFAAERSGPPRSPPAPGSRLDYFRMRHPEVAESVRQDAPSFRNRAHGSRCLPKSSNSGCLAEALRTTTAIRSCRESKDDGWIYNESRTR